MKRFYTILATLIACFLCLGSFGGCDANVYYWEFDQEISNITSVSLVEIDPNGDGLTYSVVKNLNINLAQGLYDDIQCLEMTKYGFNLKHPIDLSIVIVYANGEYEIISSVASTKFRYNSDEELRAHISWFEFNREEFDSLVEKYMSL